MAEYGFIIEVRKRTVIIMTNESRFLEIKRKPGMAHGLLVEFNVNAEQETIKKLPKKILAAVSIAAAMILLLFSYGRLFDKGSIYAYIHVDINPSIEYTIDSDFDIVGVKGLNKDGINLVKGLKVKKSMGIKEALSKTIEECRAEGFLVSNDEVVVITVCENQNRLIDKRVKEKNKYDNRITSDEEINNDGKLSKLINELKDFRIVDGGVHTKLIKGTEQLKRIASENNTSMGRYLVYEAAIKEGIGITLESVKNIDLEQIIDKISLENEVLTSKTHNNPISTLAPATQPPLESTVMFSKSPVSENKTAAKKVFMTPVKLQTPRSTEANEIILKSTPVISVTSTHEIKVETPLVKTTFVVDGTQKVSITATPLAIYTDSVPTKYVHSIPSPTPVIDNVFIEDWESNGVNGWVGNNISQTSEWFYHGSKSVMDTIAVEGRKFWSIEKFANFDLRGKRKLKVVSRYKISGTINEPMRALIFVKDEKWKWYQGDYYRLHTDSDNTLSIDISSLENLSKVKSIGVLFWAPDKCKGTISVYLDYFYAE